MMTMRTFMHKLILASAAVLAVPSAASAAITLGPVTPGTAPYSGPARTYDFESPAPVSGGLVTTGCSNGIRAQPVGSAGNYWAVGPSDCSPGVMDLASIGDIFNVSFFWGSVDAYNTIEFLGAGGVVLATFTGSDIFNPANGSQTDPNLNPLVRFDLTGSDVGALTELSLSSTTIGRATCRERVCQ